MGGLRTVICDCGKEFQTVSETRLQCEDCLGVPPEKTRKSDCQRCGEEFEHHICAHPKWCPTCRKKVKREQRVHKKVNYSDLPRQHSLSMLALFWAIAEGCTSEKLREREKDIVKEWEQMIVSNGHAYMLDWYREWIEGVTVNLNCDNCFIGDFCPIRWRTIRDTRKNKKVIDFYIFDDIKQCTKCHRMLPATEGYYNMDRSSRDGLTSRCRKCRRDDKRERRERLKESARC